MSVGVENFSGILSQMKESYLKESGEFSLASFIGLQASNFAESTEELKTITKEHETSVMAFQSNEEAQLQINVQELQKMGLSALEEFKRKLKEKQEQAKQAAIAMIDNYYDKITKIAEKHPEQSNLILALADKVTEFMKSVLTKLNEIFTKVIEAIVQAIEVAIDFITSSFKTLANSTTAFFVSLF